MPGAPHPRAQSPRDDAWDDAHVSWPAPNAGWQLLLLVQWPLVSEGAWGGVVAVGGEGVNKSPSDGRRARPAIDNAAAMSQVRFPQ